MKSSSQSPQTLRSSFLAILTLAISQTANATLLVGFHNFDSNVDNTPNTAISGFSGTVTSSSRDANLGNQDGFYGPDSAISGGIATGQSSLADGRIQNVNGVTFAVTNASGMSYSLDNLLFDLGKSNAATPISALTGLSYQIDTGVSSPILQSGSLMSATSGANSSQTVTPVSGTFRLDGGALLTPGNYHDFVVTLVGMSLANGQRIVFSWAANRSDIRIDNIAIAGISAIPEPASLLALGCVLGSGLMLRNRRIKPIQA